MSSPTPNQSKPRNKDKKSQQVMQLEHKLQKLIKQNLQLQITVKNLTQRATITKQVQISQDLIRKQQQDKLSLQIDKLQTFNQAKDDRILILTQKKDQIQIQNGCLNYQIQKLKREIDEYRLGAKQEYEDLKKHHQNQIRRYQQLVNEYQTAINQRLEYLTLNQSLNEQLLTTKQQQMRHIADKDRQKLQTIDFIRKQMHQKAKQLKANLLSMRRDQMATNTRLTVLQNHQLMEEIEYQSKHTEKVIKHNIELQKKIQWLTKQLQVEKQTVQELAKRSTVAKKIIKTLNDKNTTLEKSIEQTASNTQTSYNKKSPNQSPYKDLVTQQTFKSLSQTITHLQKQLNLSQQKLQKLQQQKNHFQQLYESNQPKYEYYLKQQTDLRLLMVRFLSSALQGRLLGEQGQVQYDISKLREMPVDDWAISDVDITVRMLLTFLKPHLTMKNLQVDYFKHQKWQLKRQHDSIDDLMHKYNQEHHKSPQVEVSHNKSRLKRLNCSKTKSFSSYNLNQTLNHTISKVNASTNVSPNKPPKESSIFSALEQLKHKSLSRKDKTRSHHDLLQPNIVTAQIAKYKNASESKQNLKLQQKHQFRPEQFKKDKQVSKLIRTNIRDWGKKVQLNPKGAFMLKNK